MQAVEVTTKDHIRQFHSFQNRIYKNDPHFIPPLRQDIEKIFDPQQNPLFREGAATRFLFYSNTEPVGRVAVFINPKTAYKEEQPTGGLGFFECINDQQVANFIFDTCRQWLQERGMEAMDGPVNFGERHEFWGCLTENFSEPGSYGMNYNPPYYAALFEEYGFQTYFNQLLFRREVSLPVPPIFMRKSKQAEASGVQVRDIRGLSDAQTAADFRDIYNGAWQDYPNFEPLTEEAARKLLKSMKPVMDKRLVIFAYLKDKPVGFYVSIPEVNELIREARGRMNLRGIFWFLYNKWRRKVHTAVGLVFGVVKEAQGMGVEGALMSYMKKEVFERGYYDRHILTWIGDFNPTMIKLCYLIGAENFRSLKTFRYLFDRSKPFKPCPVIG